MRTYKQYIEGLTKQEIVNVYYINIELIYGPEEWRWLDKRHQISNYGRARTVYKNGKTKLLLPTINSSNYLTLCINGVSHNTSRWTMMVWGQIPEGDIEVHHIDENPYNNHISNLTCKTSKEHHALHPNRKWNSFKKHSVEMINKKTGKVVMKFSSIKDAARFWSVSSSTIDRYINDGMSSKKYTYRYAD